MFARYVRLWLALARFSLLRELAFRGNFLIKIFVEVLWLSILLVFYDTVFAKTELVAGWNRSEYLLFVGINFVVTGLLETFFLENCNGFADLIRSGDLDFVLIKPMDEQFLISCRTIDWSCAPNAIMGAGVMIFALFDLPWPGFDCVAIFFVLLIAGCALAYGFLLMLTAASVWFMRNQSLMEMWWLFTTLMRYPSEIFKGTWATPVGFFFTFALPIMLVTNVPARALVRGFDAWLAAYTVFAAIVVLFVSRWVLKQALSRYRSASS